MSDFLGGRFMDAWLHEVMEDSNPMPYLGPVARFEFGPIRESWGEWRYREWLHRLGLDDAGAAARRCIVATPPLGVTWEHPYRLSSEDLVFWQQGVGGGPVFVHPRDFATLADAAREAMTRSVDKGALALQGRMAALHPTRASRSVLFFED